LNISSSIIEAAVTKYGDAGTPVLRKISTGLHMLSPQYTPFLSHGYKLECVC